MFSIERRLYVVSATRGTVHNLYVVPERRGEGIGSALLEAAETELAADGADRICLEALVGNEEARRFYENNGYGPHRIEFEKRVETDNST
ncbi:GNAT family N-acetyltransferase [Halalkalicoccus salilacus]